MSEESRDERRTWRVKLKAIVEELWSELAAEADERRTETERRAALKSEDRLHDLEMRMLKVEDDVTRLFISLEL